MIENTIVSIIKAIFQKTNRIRLVGERYPPADTGIKKNETSGFCLIFCEL